MEAHKENDIKLNPDEFQVVFPLFDEFRRRNKELAELMDKIERARTRVETARARVWEKLDDFYPEANLFQARNYTLEVNSNDTELVVKPIEQGRHGGGDLLRMLFGGGQE
jgi:hypothetical protein